MYASDMHMHHGGQVESTVILLENDICIRPFPPKVLKCLPQVTKTQTLTTVLD